MKHIQNFTVIFLIISFSIGCKKQPNIDTHINNIGKINSSIITYKNDFINKQNNINYSIERDDFKIKRQIETFNHEISQSDTIIYLSYKYCLFDDNKKMNGYKSIHLTKQYFENDNYHTLEIFNNDTLYHYTTINKPEESLFFIDYKFISGKYYFMATHNSGFLKEDQLIYFILNVDSLISIKGNNLPPLQGIDTISLSIFFKSDLYHAIIKEKHYLQ